MKRFKYLTLAALVGLWACDSGTSTTTEPVTTGTISGTVTIEGTGASGVTVTLSSGTTTTTAADGTYAFSSVNAGAYTVAISGYASDATFDATTKAATITTAGQVATVNFAGSYIKTSSIVGVVSAGAGPLGNVTVTLGGAASSSTTTDAAGSYSFSGLRAGSYTVTISGYGSEYTFPATSQSATLGVGESKVVSFSGSYVTTAVVSGRMFLDENAKDGVYTAGLEDNLSVANVTVTLELSVGNDITTQTDADGMYTFGNLPPGTYRVSIDATSSAIPGSVAFGGTSPQVVTVTAGGQAVVNWPFDIVQETVKAYGFLGTDASVSDTPGPGITPIEGWAMSLYPTEADAVASTHPLESGVKTDAMGAATFTFDRADDYSPNGGPSDQIVFAKYGPLPNNTYQANGETVIEIKYNAKDSLASAPDTFDALYNQLVIKAHAEEIDSDTLAGWGMVMLDNADTTAAVQYRATDANGDAIYTVNPGGGDSDGVLPDTLWFRLGFAQPLANGHAFTMTPSVGRGTAAGQYVMFIWDGTVLPSDTVAAGVESVKYLDADLSFVVHHETDDTVGLTAGDDFMNANAIDVDLDTLKSDGSVATLATGSPDALAGDGVVMFANAKTAFSYVVRSRSHNASAFVLNDTTVNVVMDGSDQEVAYDDAFAFKTMNNTVEGWVENSDGDGVPYVIVTLTPTDRNIQGTAMAVDTTPNSGYYSFAGVVEGPYTVSVADIAGKWAFFDTLDAPDAGTADNTDAYSGLRDVQGWGDTQEADFMPRRMNGVIDGQVVNDRDGDNTLDPSDALAGAVMELHADSATGTLVTTATTDSDGSYSFTALREGNYVVKWSTDTPDANQDVLRALATDTTDVLEVTATDDVLTDSPNLPSWNYDDTMAENADDADFVFLAKNTIAKGTVKDANGGVAGMTVSLRRCDESSGATKPVNPAGGTCTTYLGTTVTTQTDANGNFQFDNLTEGVYQIAPQPGTVGSYDTSTPTSALYLQKNPSDVENFTFTVSVSAPN